MSDAKNDGALVRRFAYSTPVLSRIGKVTELTESGSNPTNEDNNRNGNCAWGQLNNSGNLC